MSINDFHVISLNETNGSNEHLYPSDLRLVLSHFINCIYIYIYIYIYILYILYIQLYYMFIYNFQINIFIGILQGLSIKFGIESKNILPLDGRPEHSQRIIKIKNTTTIA